MGSEKSQPPKVTRLFRAKEGIQTQFIRFQTPFLSQSLCQKRRGNWAQRGINHPKSHGFVEPKKGFRLSSSDSKLHSSLKACVRRDMDRLDLWGSWRHLRRGQWTKGRARPQAPASSCGSQHPRPWSPRTFPPSPAQASPHLLRRLIHASGRLSSQNPATGHTQPPSGIAAQPISDNSSMSNSRTFGNSQRL